MKGPIPRLSLGPAVPIPLAYAPSRLHDSTPDEAPSSCLGVLRASCAQRWCCRVLLHAWPPRIHGHRWRFCWWHLALEFSPRTESRRDFSRLRPAAIVHPSAFSSRLLGVSHALRHTLRPLHCHSAVGQVFRVTMTPPDHANKLIVHHISARYCAPACRLRLNR